ncbi:conserved hypothetical protein [Methanospirillum hungatei JF-1]|nr:conserved hypothetical protein [Methanospirillum hungatei JF-1]
MITHHHHHKHGSSPYTRGTQHRTNHPEVLVRFIPIHTGNSYCHFFHQGWCAVHPHTHGELQVRDLLTDRHSGSSPYTRGTPASTHSHVSACRFIPIHTGNSRDISRRVIVVSVHPHTHGELYTFVDDAVIRIGSSPYTRGTLFPFSPLGGNALPPDAHIR